MVNVGKYTMHGSYGLDQIYQFFEISDSIPFQIRDSAQQNQQVKNLSLQINIFATNYFHIALENRKKNTIFEKSKHF